MEDINEAKGFPNLPCLKCGVYNGLTLQLDDLDTIHCNECDDDYTIDEVQTAMERWAPVLAWIASAPPRSK